MQELRESMPIEVIRQHPRNVRNELGDLTELAASIAEIGLLQPLVVAPADDVPGTYLTIAGNRRRAAAILAGLTDVPAIIRVGLTEAQVYQAMLIENLHRVGLTPMEEAVAIKGLYDGGMTQMEIAKSIGKSDAFVCDRLVLNELPPELRRRLIDKTLRITEAVRLAKVLAGRSPEAVDRGWDTPHFAKAHRLWPAARARCIDEGHGLRRLIGGACGACWEHVIRADEGGAELSIDDGSEWWSGAFGAFAHLFGRDATISLCGTSRARDVPASASMARCKRCENDQRVAVDEAAFTRYEPPVPVADQRGEVVTRAQDLAVLSALAGGARLTVMTATPERVRATLDRVFDRLMASVEAQQEADRRERRTLEQAVTEFVEQFEDDQPASVAG